MTTHPMFCVSAQITLFTIPVYYKVKMASYVAIKAPVKAKSEVWKYFGHPIYVDNEVRKPDTSVTICKVGECKAELRYTGNTTNMAKHIERKHPGIRLTIKGSRLGNTSNNNNSTEPTVVTEQSQSVPIPVSLVTGQTRLSEAFKHKYGANSQKANKINKAIGKWVASDLRPYSVVDNKYFRDLILLLDDRYNSQKGNTLVRK